MDPSQALNQFSEEACRDLFVELGIEIAREYRYTQGIREVQARVLEAFGEDDYPKAMMMFDELLRDEFNALGLGDEGDLWRSWRHEYKLKKAQMSRPRSAHFPRIPSPSPSAAFAQFHRRPTSLIAIPEAITETSNISEGQFSSFSQLGNVRIEEVKVIDVRNTQPNILSRIHSYRSIASIGGHLPARNLRTKISQVLGRGASRQSSRHQSVILEDPNAPSSPVPPKLPPIFFDGPADQDFPGLPHNRQAASAGSVIDVYHYPSVTVGRDPLEYLSMTEDELLDEIHHPGVAELPADSPVESSNGSKRNTSTSGSSGSRSSKISNFSSSSRTQFARLARDALAASHDELGSLPPIADRSFSSQTVIQSPRISITPSLENEMLEKYRSQLQENPFGHSPGHPEYRDTTISTFIRQQSGLYQDIGELLPRGPLPTSFSEGSIHSRAPAATPIIRHRPSAIQVPRGRARGNSSTSNQPGSPTRPLQTINEHASQEGLHRMTTQTTRSQSPYKHALTCTPHDEAGDLSYSRISIDAPGEVTKRPRSPMKRLFGEHGLLGKSSSMKELSGTTRPSHLQRLGGKLRDKVGDLTIEVSKFKFPTFNAQISPVSPQPPHLLIAITQDPPTQARLYSELELMITATANRFLIQQTSQGRISPETVAKVTLAWKNKGRPQVIEFQFDQLTQRDLVLYNLKTVRFSGRRSLNEKHCDGVMLAWRKVGKDMACRTFCFPDSMIKKHLFDVAKLLELLGAPDVTLMAFDQMAAKTVRRTEEEQRKRRAWAEAVMGKERVWDTPPTPKTPGMRHSMAEMGWLVGESVQGTDLSSYERSEEERGAKQKQMEISPFMKFAS